MYIRISRGCEIYRYHNEKTEEKCENSREAMQCEFCAVHEHPTKPMRTAVQAIITDLRYAHPGTVPIDRAV